MILYQERKKMKNKKIKFIPFGTRCLVKRRETKTTSEGGIILAMEAEKLPEGMVIAVGNDCESVAVGDYVIFGNFTGHEVMNEEVVCLVVLEEEIIGRFDGVTLDEG